MQEIQIREFGLEEAAAINALYSEVERHCDSAKKEFRAACAKSLQMGERLISLKGTMAHGQFVTWMKHHLTFTPRWAQILIKVAKAKRDSHLSEEMSYRALMIALGIIPSQTHAQGRALNINPDPYGPLNFFNRYRSALPSPEAELWRNDPAERAAMRQQYLPLREWLDELFSDQGALV